MVFSIISEAVKAILEMDHIGTEDYGDKVVYKFKTTGLNEGLVEKKAKILSILDFPVDIPVDVSVREVKRGPVFREYVVEITCTKRGLGSVRNLFKSKYGVVKRWRR